MPVGEMVLQVQVSLLRPLLLSVLGSVLLIFFSSLTFVNHDGYPCFLHLCRELAQHTTTSSNKRYKFLNSRLRNLKVWNHNTLVTYTA